MTTHQQPTPQASPGMVVLFMVAGAAALAAGLAGALRHDDVEDSLRDVITGVVFMHLAFARVSPRPEPGARRHLATASDLVIALTLVTVNLWTFL